MLLQHFFFFPIIVISVCFNILGVLSVAAAGQLWK